MPTLTRVLVGLVILLGVFAAMVWSLATFVDPHPREMVIKVPQERLEAR